MKINCNTENNQQRKQLYQGFKKWQSVLKKRSEKEKERQQNSSREKEKVKQEVKLLIKFICIG
jgi:hypothetical protein